ncbi:hypothetical protein RF11_02913 [Thelohanellus kitauei]|uniref:Uncharacterized protein n=1 Tax=Thelohanellus kitauei TaxID=669202 RepID=A0A0C2J0P0_THEKT|nr:hypothetical protein RF11_02913 [Thelohanellus kitauei]
MRGLRMYLQVWMFDIDQIIAEIRVCLESFEIDLCNDAVPRLGYYACATGSSLRDFKVYLDEFESFMDKFEMTKHSRHPFHIALQDEVTKCVKNADSCMGSDIPAKVVANKHVFDALYWHAHCAVHRMFKNAISRSNKQKSQNESNSGMLEKDGPRQNTSDDGSTGMDNGARFKSSNPKTRSKQGPRSAKEKNSRHKVDQKPVRASSIPSV